VSGAVDFEAFRQLVARTPPLQDRLLAETDPHDFIPLVVELAHAHGHVIGPDDVRAAMAAGRRAWVERWVV